MDKLLFSFIILLAMLKLSVGDRKISSGGVSVKALGRSGKISIGFRENIDTDPNRVVIEMDDLKERARNGDEVGKSGPASSKHSFNTFASQDFTFTNAIDDTLQNISVKSFQFSSSLIDGAANLTVTVYVFKEDGNITLDDEETEVQRGNVKFSISLQNWKFCGTGSGDVSCRKGNTNEEGAFIDFTITIKGKGTPRRKNETDDRGGRKRGQKYDLGGNGEVILSEKVQYDGGNYTDMVSGYPKTEQRGSKTSFVFRFEKFSESVFYDPTINAIEGSGGGDTTTSSPSGVSRTSLSPIFGLLMLAMTMFLTKYV